MIVGAEPSCFQRETCPTNDATIELRITDAFRKDAEMKARDLCLAVLLALSTCWTQAEPTADEKYTLRYKFALDESVRWRVVHLATNETTIRGNTQSSKSRSSSTKVWHVTKVDKNGYMTISHSIESVDMWQQLPDSPEVRYNSKTDEIVPPVYQQVAQTIGVPITTVTIDATGKIIDRQSNVRQSNFGLGDIVMLLPPKPVKAGSRWYEPAEIPVRLPDKKIKRIKIRKRYTLERVQTGVATISLKTEVLTPVNDASVQAQLAQQLTAGTIKFDVDAGRVMSKKIDWNENVVGFDGAESQMKYLARFTEELLNDESTTPSTRTARAKKRAAER